MLHDDTLARKKKIQAIYLKIVNITADVRLEIGVNSPPEPIFYAFSASGYHLPSFPLTFSFPQSSLLREIVLVTLFHIATKKEWYSSCLASRQNDIATKERVPANMFKNQHFAFQGYLKLRGFRLEYSIKGDRILPPRAGHLYLTQHHVKQDFIFTRSCAP